MATRVAGVRVRRAAVEDGTESRAGAPATKRRELTRAQYQQLAEFRFQLRRFLSFSQDAAEQSGVRPQQHQLLLAVQGIPDGLQATIANVAARLMLRHNSAVELVDRTVEQGLLRRAHDPGDHRQILLRLTAEGERVLRSLAAHHLEELEVAGAELIRALRRIVKPGATMDEAPAGARGRTA